LFSTPGAAVGAAMGTFLESIGYELVSASSLPTAITALVGETVAGIAVRIAICVAGGAIIASIVYGVVSYFRRKTGKPKEFTEEDAAALYEAIPPSERAAARASILLLLRAFDRQTS